MFKLLCLMTIGMCGTQSPGSSDELWHVKFEVQQEGESQENPCTSYGMTIEQIKNLWEECANKTADTKTYIYIDGKYQEVDIIRTEYCRENFFHKEIRLCFAIDKDKAVYFVNETKIPATDKLPEKYSYTPWIYTNFFSEWRQNPTFEIFDIDGKTKLTPTFSTDKNSSKITLKEGVELGRYDFERLIRTYDEEKDIKKVSRKIMRALYYPAPIFLVQDWENSTPKISFQLARTDLIEEYRDNNSFKIYDTDEKTPLRLKFHIDLDNPVNTKVSLKEGIVLGKGDFEDLIMQYNEEKSILEANIVSKETIRNGELLEAYNNGKLVEAYTPYKIREVYVKYLWSGGPYIAINLVRNWLAPEKIWFQLIDTRTTQKTDKA